MPFVMEDRPLQVRCYRCGSPAIACLCHHCGNAMCGRHSPAVTNSAGKPVSDEFSGLGLSQAGAYHCTEHAHTVKGGLLALVARAHQRRSAETQATRPPLPVIPAVDSVSVLETLSGMIRQDEGVYRAVLERAEGRLDVVMALTESDLERVDTYRRVYRLADDDPIDFSAGFAVIRGEARFAFTPEVEQGAMPLLGGTGIWFGGDVRTHPLFGASSGRSPAQWNAHMPYTLQGANTPTSIPVWLVPSLFPASDQRTLEVDLYQAAMEDMKAPFALNRFELIELIVPMHWGNVESVMPAAQITISDKEPNRIIRWRDIPPAAGWGGQSVTLTIKFENRIDQSDNLAGRLQASFDGSVSGILDVDIFQPLGGRRPSRSRVETRVSVEFVLSLSTIEYQAVRIIPDRGQDAGRVKADEFLGVIPDHLTIIDLTNELSDEGYYIKSITESPAYTGAQTNVVNRCWDIEGTRYPSILPIHFHITVTGEEKYQGGTRAQTGNTVARITVRGLYANAETLARVDEEWFRLHDLVTEGLRERTVFPPASDFDQQGFVNPTTPHAGHPTGEDRIAREIALRRRLDAATDALLSGKISEEIYREIKADIEAELAEG